MIIDLREEAKNAFDSILRNSESDSIEIDESDLQSLKQDEPRISTVRGVMIDVREEPQDASDSVARTKRSEPIQTVNRRKRIRPTDSNVVASGPPSSSRNAMPSIVTTDLSDTR
jgi:hypothetical protein